MRSLLRLRFIIPLLALLVSLAGTPLAAEYRMYRSSKPRDALLRTLLDEMGRAGFRYSVRKVYNEKKDGKLGFLFWLYPGKYFCEILFYERNKGKTSMIRIYTQNTRVARRFHRLFTKRMKMKPVGLVKEKRGHFPRPR